MRLTTSQIFSFISIGELAAPVLGGVVYKKAGYIGVFGISFGILAIDFIMRLLLIEKKVAARYHDNEQDANAPPSQEDEETEESSEDSEEDPLLGKEKENYKVPPDQPKVIRGFPLLYCLRDPRLLTAFLLAFVQATLLSNFDATIPTEAQNLFDFDSLKAGLLFIALDIPYLLLGPLAGWSVDNYGTKPAAVIGFGYLAPVLVLLRIPHQGGKSQIIIFCACLSLCGVGLAIIGSPSIVEASQVVQRYHKANPDFFGEQGPYAQLYGINSMVFSAGLTLGPVLSGMLRDAIGYGNMNIVLAAISLITASLAFVFVGGTPGILKRFKS